MQNSNRRKVMFSVDRKSNQAQLCGFQTKPPTTAEGKKAQEQARADRERFVKSAQLAQPSEDREAKGTHPVSILKKTSDTAKTGDYKKGTKSTCSSFCTRSALGVRLVVCVRFGVR